MSASLPFETFAEALLDELCRTFPLGYRPKIQWKGLRVSAGIAYYRIGVIALSTRVLTDEATVKETLTHEYAHLLAYQRHGQKGAGHGPAWRQAMQDLGLEPKVRHSLPVERNTPRQKVVYRCRNCGKQFSRSRRFPKRTRYLHVNCGGELQLVGVLRAKPPET